jgi:DNA-binding beta-propeller fold protein YncE
MTRALGLLLLAAAGLLAGCGSGSSTGKVEKTWGQPGAELGNFVKPRGLAVDPKGGFVYVADMSGRIQKFDLDGSALASWKVPDTELGTSEGLAVTSGGDLLVADTHYHRVLRYRFAPGEPGGLWTRLAGESSPNPYVIGERGDGPGQFRFPIAVAVDPQDNFYVSEYGGNDRVQKFDAAGRCLLSWGALGSEPGQFIRPSGVAVEAGGNILVADAANHRIQRFSPDGKFLAAWGRLGRGGGGGELHYPYDVAALSDGSFVVAENYNHRLQRFSADGQPLGICGGPGREPGQFSRPWCLAAAGGGVVYVSDTMNHRIQRVRFAVEEKKLSVASCQLPVTDGWELAISGSLLHTGNWQLGTGN